MDIQSHPKQQLSVRRCHIFSRFQSTSKQNSSLIRLFCSQDLWSYPGLWLVYHSFSSSVLWTTNLILSINPSLNLPRLDQSNNLPFKLFNSPSECLTHSLQFDRSKRLEIKNDRAVPYLGSQSGDMRRQLYINVMSSLKKPKSVTLRNFERTEQNRILTENRSRVSRTMLNLLFK